jgi:hypothetical protein
MVCERGLRLARGRGECEALEMKNLTSRELRSERLGRRHRRILGWSLGVAGVLHIAVFALNPEWVLSRIDLLVDRSLEDRDVPPAVALIDVTFGPPRILLADGTATQEPPDRVLEATEVDLRGIRWSRDCDWVRTEGFGSAAGEVRLEVGEGGFVSRARISRSSGEGCLDQVLVSVAGTVWYRWLPRADAPAPVDLIQPILIEPAS